MAGLVEETNHEIGMVQEDKDTREAGAYDPPVQSNNNFLLELNLLTIVLSLSSLSSEDCLNYAATERERFEDHEDQVYISRLPSRRQDIYEAQACISKLPSRRHDIHEVKLAGKRAQRFQPMIKDSRHGRRM